jgi:hypothetical protein
MVEQNKTQDDLTDDRHTLSNCRLTIGGGIIIIKPKISFHFAKCLSEEFLNHMNHM